MRSYNQTNSMMSASDQMPYAAPGMSRPPRKAHDISTRSDATMASGFSGYPN